jgi:hypothetical protein
MTTKSNARRLRGRPSSGRHRPRRACAPGRCAVPPHAGSGWWAPSRDKGTAPSRRRRAGRRRAGRRRAGRRTEPVVPSRLSPLRRRRSRAVGLSCHRQPRPIADAPGCGIEPDHDKINQMLNTVMRPLLDEESRRFDPTILAISTPYGVGDAGLLQLLVVWREGAWRNAERLVAAGNDANARARRWLPRSRTWPPHPRPRSARPMPTCRPPRRPGRATRTAPRTTDRPAHRVLRGSASAVHSPSQRRAAPPTPGSRGRWRAGVVLPALSNPTGHAGQ